MKKKRRILTAAMLVVILFGVLTPIANAAFFSKQISTTDSATQTMILNLVKEKEGTEKYNKMYHLFYTSDYAAASRQTWPHLNGGSSVSSVTDGGVKYTLDKSAWGCMAYSYFVSKYVFGKSSLNYNYIDAEIGSYTGEDIKKFILLYAQSGEQIRIDGTHSISYVVNDANGFYYLSYYDDSNPYIYIAYTTWEKFANECNAKNKKIWIYDADTSINEGTDYDEVMVYDGYKDVVNTITENNAVLVGTVQKPADYAAEMFGIRIRLSNDTFDNGWSYYHNASSAYSGTTNIKIWFNVQEELGVTLKHANSYSYQLYAKVNGKEYWSEEKTFTTTGDHSFDSGNITQAPTCKETGIKTYTCTVCGDSYTEEIAKLTTHSYENGTCTVCGGSDPDYVPPTEPTDPTEPTEPEVTEPTEPVEPEDEEEKGGFFAAIAAFFEAIFRILFWFLYL